MKKQIAIIGAGDIVKKRLKPALEKLGYEIIIFTNILEEGTNFIDEEDNWLKDLTDVNLIWIATPSFVHINYLKKIIKLNKFIVMEKPITCFEKEINEVKEILDVYDRNNIFFTSYYLLEKALPLYFFKNTHEAYLKYLDFYENDECRNFDISEIINSLGKLKSINIKIIEGKDIREWPYLKNYGTHFLETFLHNLLIATQFVSNPTEWDDKKLIFDDFIEVKSEKSPCSINLLGKDNDIYINLLMQKNKDVSLIERNAVLEFENGVVFMDTETQILKISLGEKTYTIKTKEFYTKIKYSIQIDLSLRCFEKELNTFEVDSLVNQLDLIDFILEELKKELN